MSGFPIASKHKLAVVLAFHIVGMALQFADAVP
jgi:hypothetical protein